jgi:hypothetical protein
MVLPDKVDPVFNKNNNTIIGSINSRITLLDQYLMVIIFGDLISNFIAFGLGVRLMGPLFVLGFYILLALHVYAFFAVILTVLRKRLGTEFGIIWVAIGLILVYNIAYNHFFATIIKPGGPEDLKVIIIEDINRQ